MNITVRIAKMLTKTSHLITEQACFLGRISFQLTTPKGEYLQIANDLVGHTLKINKVGERTYLGNSTSILSSWPGLSWE